jgi:hypothetical protein
MTGLSSKGELIVLSSILTECYVSLHTADPGDTGAAEVAVGGYARQGPAPFAPSGANPTVASNSAIVAFGTATADWGSIAYFGAWDNIVGGNFVGSGPLDVARQVLSGDTVRFLVGALKITAD